MPEFTDEDDALLGELGVEAEPKPAPGRTAREERVLAGFEEIQAFVARHGRAPLHGAERDIFERLYAVRLDRLRALEDCRTLLAPFDSQGLLAPSPASHLSPDALDDDELLAELGVGADPGGIEDLRHVRSAAEKRAADEIATRQPCDEFASFKPILDGARAEIESGLRQTRRFERKSEIAAGRLYILGGQLAFVAAMDEPFTNEQNTVDARLRVIFDNGTESNLLMRSLQKALQQDPTGRRVLDPAAGPLFADRAEDGDTHSGVVYVLRSKSEHPYVAAHRDLLHKIGVTGGSVAARVANARLDPTFLMADVEVVATYELFNVNPTRLEAVIHRVFAAARLDLAVKDRFDLPVAPREWFLVPRNVIDQAIGRIRDRSIAGCVYDPATASLT